MNCTHGISARGSFLYPPFPSAEYQTAAFIFPRLVPIRPDGPGAYDNRVAIERLKTLDLPVLLPWADGDPITAPAEAHLRSISG
jgi:hypothetical protein